MSNWKELTNALTINGMINDLVDTTPYSAHLFSEDEEAFIDAREAARKLIKEIPGYYFASFETKKLAKHHNFTEEQIEEYGWENLVNYYYNDYEDVKYEWWVDWYDVESINRNFAPIAIDYLTDINFEDKTGTLEAIEAGIPMEDVLA